MSKTNTTIKLPAGFTGSFSYVDCGAVGDYSNSLLDVFSDSRLIGFDPELSQPLHKNDSSVYFPVALGKEFGEVKFYRTQNPNCSSMFVPNQEFLDHFVQVGDFFRIIETISVKVVNLDVYLPQQNINDIDFVELDAQGAELDILNGAQNFLKDSIIGMKIEVEFAHMYQNQPLFADVDSRLRESGFVLFSLERFHLRRKSCPSDIDSREQIVWGQALYLRDYRSIPSNISRKQKLSKLAMVASYHGLHGYALETVNYLMQQAGLLVSTEKQELEHLTFRYISELRKESQWSRLHPLEKSFLGGAFRNLRLLYKFIQSFKRKHNYFWKD